MKSKKLLSTIILVLTLTLFAKFFGLVRNSIIGSTFGISAESDAYSMALRITSQLFMTLGSAITATSIPIVIGHISKENKSKSNYFISNAMTTLVVFTGVITVLGIGFSPFLVKLFAFGYDESTLKLTTDLVKIMFPILTLIPAVYLFVSILQSHGNFSVTSLISIPYNFVLISYLVFFSKTYGIQGLAVATLLGWILQALIQLPFVLKKGFRYKAVMNIKDEDLKTLLILIVPILASSAVYNVNMLIDSAIASTLSAGSVSALAYSFVVYTAVSSTIIYGVSTVLFPNFAKFIAADNIDGLKSELTTIIKGMLFLVIPMIFGVLALKVEIIEIIYMRKNFTYDDVILTSGPLGFYMIGMIGFAFQDIFNRVFFALKNTKLPLITSIISVSINIVLNLILIQFFDLNGLAMATTIAVITNGILLYVLLSKEIGKFNNKSLAVSSLKILFSSLLMYITVKYFMTLNIVHSVAIATLVSVLIGILVYSCVAILLKVESAIYLMNTIKQKLRK